VHSLAHRLKFILENVMVAAFGKGVQRTGSGGLVSARGGALARVWEGGPPAGPAQRAAAEPRAPRLPRGWPVLLQQPALRAGRPAPPRPPLGSGADQRRPLLQVGGVSNLTGDAAADDAFHSLMEAWAVAGGGAAAAAAAAAAARWWWRRVPT
jgi:hypothetical protein